MMTKAERAELKSIVRQQFKVLRGEVSQRQAELLAEAKSQIAEHMAKQQEDAEALQFLVNQAVLECNRKINDLIYEAGFEKRGDTERMWVQAPAVFGKRCWGNGMPIERMEQAAYADLTARVSTAMAALARQEADLLRDLAVGALESDDARAFLSQIPTVSQLVPAVRLAELEKRLMG